jgi:hypothetical protein
MIKLEVLEKRNIYKETGGYLVSQGKILEGSEFGPLSIFISLFVPEIHIW